MRLTSQVKADLKWWINILNSPFTSISFQWLIKNPSTADIHVWSDASGSNKLGFGAYSSLGHFIQIKWDSLPLPSDMNWDDIHFPEFLALTVAAVTWAPTLNIKQFISIVTIPQWFPWLLSAQPRKAVQIYSD